MTLLYPTFFDRAVLLCSWKFVKKSYLNGIKNDLLKLTYLNDSSMYCRVSVQGVESLWGDCRFIPADWGS